MGLLDHTGRLRWLTPPFAGSAERRAHLVSQISLALQELQTFQEPSGHTGLDEAIKYMTALPPFRHDAV